EDSAGGILTYRHAAEIEHIEGARVDFAAGLGHLGGGSVGTRDGNVNSPVRRYPLRDHIRAQCVSGARILAFELEHGVDLVRTHGEIRRAPSEQGAKEALGGILVIGGQFQPAERSRGVSIDGWHRPQYNSRYCGMRRRFWSAG